MSTFLRIAALAATLAAMPLPGLAQDGGLPGGASQLQETYDDWQVTCSSQGERTLCAMAQSQLDGQSRQRVLAIEINAISGDSASGVLLLPFGLALAQPVALQVDEGAGTGPLTYRTCLPAGCLVPLAFDGGMVGALRAGTALKVAAIADGGKPANFSVSLKGFSKALDRVASLAR